MRVRVIIEGHQIHREYIGEVVQWGTTVEAWRGPAERQHLQVPCVMLDTGKSIETVSLRTELTWCSRIEKLPDLTAQELDVILATKDHV